MAKSGTAKLRPRARIINLIGEELISDEPVALVELVKNAYDADATEVHVEFSGDVLGKPEAIIVRDNGIGMDLKTVLNCWFEPGTTMKKKKGRSPGGRLYLGAKGIGRFASARLAQSLLLESRPPKSKQVVCAVLDWGKFDDDSYLDDIEIIYDASERSDFQPGTVLTLDGVRKQQWTKDDYENLHARLARLLSPFEKFGDFSIALDIPGYEYLSGIVEPPQLILKPKYCLNGKINENGCFTGKLTIDGRLTKKFTKLEIGGKSVKPKCGPFDIEIRAWDRDRESLAIYEKEFSQGIREIRRTLSTFCGVSIYRDGFRVHPYGEQGDDWLKLDNRSRQTPARSLANNQIIGAIRISRDTNRELRDRSTREGMVKNDAHQSLEVWFTLALSLLEEERYRVRPRKKIEDSVEPLFEALDISDTVKEVHKQLGSQHPVSALVTATEQQLQDGVSRIQEVYSRLLMSSGLGHMVDLVIHEIGAPSHKVNRQLVIAERDMKKKCEDSSIEHFGPMITNMKSWLEQIHILRERLDPQTPAKRGRASVFTVQDEVTDNFYLYESLIDKQGIEWRVRGARNPIDVKMSRATFDQIMANLIDNSIYWIMDSKGVGNGGEIDVQLRTFKNGFKIVISDDGRGVPEKDRARIFEPYFSTKRGGSGMGLGLYICRLLIEPYGKIVYRDDLASLSGACFEVTFERKVGR